MNQLSQAVYRPDVGDGPGRGRRGRGRPLVPALMGAVGGSLVVMSALHLGHVIQGGSKPYDPTSAGIAEAVIALVLLAAAVAVRNALGGARPLALGALGFAVAGFVLGLMFTATGGTVVDVAYHVVGLPVVLLTLLLEYRSGRAADHPTEGP
jgi:hypothetical protein